MSGHLPAPTGLLLLLLLFFAHGEQPLAPVTVKTTLSANTVPVNGEVVFSIELSWQGVLDDVRIEALDEPDTDNLALSGRGSANRVIADSLEGRRALKRFDFYFKPQATGRARIKPVRVRYLYRGHSRTVYSDAAFFEITPAVEKSRPVFIPGSILLWGVLVLFIAAVVFVSIRFFWVRRKHSAPDDPRLPVGEKYRRLLLTTIHPSNGQDRENRADMLKLLDSYLLERAGETRRGSRSREAMLAGMPGDEKVKERLVKMLRDMESGEGDDAPPVQKLYEELEAFFKGAAARGWPGQGFRP